MSQYLCWNCGLMQGDESEPLEASKLCPACKAAMNRGHNRECAEVDEQ